MESLLSLSFDYLSSHDAVKIRKGLRQLEGLLAQICLSATSLSSSPSSPEKKRHSTAFSSSNTKTQHPPKQLSQLVDDAAFREFFKLQEGFEWNVALRLTSSLEHLLGHPNTGQNDLLLISTLDLLHGVLLIHPPSRTLFSREIAMNLLLDMLDPSLCPAIQSSTLLTLVTALLACPKNTRTFEKLDGLLTVTSLFKSRAASREVKMKSVEFLYFYLMPETSSSGTTGGGSREKEDSGSSTKSEMTGSRMGAGRKLGGVKIDTRSTEEKQALLGKYLNNVEDLVEDLRESAPFGAGYA